MRAFGALLRGRTRDRRFDVFSASIPAIVITLALFATGLVLLAVFADPHVLRYQRRAAGVGRGRSSGSSTGSAKASRLCALPCADPLQPGARSHGQIAARPRARLHAGRGVAVSIRGGGRRGPHGSLLKFIIGRARPRLFDQDGPFAFDMFGPGSAWASFPSGHTTTIMSCAMAFALLVPRWRVAISDRRCRRRVRARRDRRALSVGHSRRRRARRACLMAVRTRSGAAAHRVPVRWGRAAQAAPLSRAGFYPGGAAPRRHPSPRTRERSDGAAAPPGEGVRTVDRPEPLTPLAPAGASRPSPYGRGRWRAIISRTVWTRSASGTVTCAGRLSVHSARSAIFADICSPSTRSFTVTSPRAFSSEP